MSSTVSMNDATEEQLAVLLELNPDQVHEVVRRRPFRSQTAAAAALPANRAARLNGLDIPKLNINVSSADGVIGRRVCG